MIYLDHAATSWPKPPEVLKAMTDFLGRSGGNPGRSGHRLSIEAARVLYDAREELAVLFNVSDPLRVIFTLNATHAINIVLRGLLKPGDCVVTSSMEHNAVMRPLRALERDGISVRVVHCAAGGALNPADVERVVDSSTRLVVLNHASNVVGTIQPVAEIASIAHSAGALLLADAAQTAGIIPIDIGGMGIDFLAFTGHKGLQGPPGTGGLVLGEKVDISTIEPLVRGGTGSQSELEEQPEHLPDKYECGTPNGAGIAGLLAGVQWVKARGVEMMRSHEIKLTQSLLEGLQDIPGVTVYGTRDASKSAAVISFTVDGLRVSDIGLRLDEEFGVLCRVGLHCAPAAHHTIGTFPEGTVRFSPGFFTSMEDIRKAVSALRSIVLQ